MMTALAAGVLTTSAWTGFAASHTVRTALIVGSVVAVICAMIGCLVVLQADAFSAHALADLGAVGGAGAFVIGMNQLAGFLIASLIFGWVMEGIGVRRIRERDTVTGLVLGTGLGLTALFLYLGAQLNSSTSTMSVLFGSLFSMLPDAPYVVIGLGLVVVVAVVLVGRQMMLVCVDENLAQAAGINVRLIRLVFTSCLSLAVALSSYSIGAVLSTALIVIPASAAMVISHGTGQTMACAATFGVLAVWIGTALSYASYGWTAHHVNWPVSFWIVVVVALEWLAARVFTFCRTRMARGNH